MDTGIPYPSPTEHVGINWNMRIGDIGPVGPRVYVERGYAPVEDPDVTGQMSVKGSGICW